MTANEFDKHPELGNDFWGEHPDFPLQDWQYEVACDNTRLGYWDWVNHQLEPAVSGLVEAKAQMSCKELKMIKFVTDQKPGEPNILEGNEMKPLLVKNLDGDLLSTLAPSEPWTHERLCGLDLETFVDEQTIEKVMRYGADAYLGDVWIGSTEI